MWFGASGSGLELVQCFVFLHGVGYPNDRLSGFVMATKTCRAVPEAIKFDEKPICVEIEL